MVFILYLLFLYDNGSGKILGVKKLQFPFVIQFNNLLCRLGENPTIYQASGQRIRKIFQFPLIFADFI